MLSYIRKLKASYMVYNFFKKKELAYNEVQYQKYGINKRYFSSVSSLDFEHIKGERNWLDVADSRVELPKHEVFQQLSSQHQTPLLEWSANGCAILPSFFSTKEVEAVNQDIEKLLQNNEAQHRYDARIMFAIESSKAVRHLGKHPQLTAILNMLLGKQVDVFQSINFTKGSQQRTHSDSIHMTTFPLGNMIAAWVALEDIQADSGPLHYYLGSHRLPYVLNADYDNTGNRIFIGKQSYRAYEDKIESIVKEQQLQKSVFLAKKGDVFIWHANLLHGGEAVLNPNVSRKSVVFHYYAKDAVCYHEITQRPSLKKVFI